MPRTIAIGDIHGCSKTFFTLLQKLDIAVDDELYLIGDYIDRGPDSKGVITTILSLQQNGYKVHCLRGNHEQMMLDSEKGFSAYSEWVKNGGDITLDNFKVDYFNEIPKIYHQFFIATKTHFVTDDYIFAHAGLNFENDNIFEDEDAMLWIRNFDRNQKALGNKLLIHGHTPMPLDFIINQKTNCINLDVGCVYASKDKYIGYLVAVVLDTMEYVYVKMED